MSKHGRLIDADALEKYLSDAEIEATRQRKYVFASALNTICGNVRNFPTIEPEREKGRWVDVTDGICVWKVCDQCGEKPLWNEWKTDRNLSNFCPNCGADMRGGKE